MRLRRFAILVGMLLCLTPTMGWADLTPYNQDFETLVQADPAALANDGWLVFGNVFKPDWSYDYGYGPFPAPNGGAAFSAIDVGQGGPPQGLQQLSVYSDYNNGDHGAGKFIEANVFQEQVIGAADVDTTWLFEYDAKRGNIAGGTTARAFFKTLDPNNNFALTNFIWVDMTNVSADWTAHSLSIYIDASLAGQILQFGFLSTATFYEGSGIFYDNIRFGLEPVDVAVDVKPESCPNPLNVRAPANLPVAILGDGVVDVTTIDPASIRLAGAAPLRSDYEDVGTPFDPYSGKEDCELDCSGFGPDGRMDLTLKFDTQEVADGLGGAHGDCVVARLTGNFWPQFGGGPIAGEDVVVIIDRTPRPRILVGDPVVINDPMPD